MRVGDLLCLGCGRPLLLHSSDFLGFVQQFCSTTSAYTLPVVHIIVPMDCLEKCGTIKVLFLLRQDGCKPLALQD